MAFVLSDRDRQKIAELVADKRGMVRKTRPAQPVDEKDTSPNVYVVRTPEDGIPALTEEPGTGTYDMNDTPGSADCDVWQLIDDALEPSEAGPITVWNMSGLDIPGDTWQLATQDKFGTWWVISVESEEINCIAVMDACLGIVRYVHTYFGRVVVNDDPCDHCIDFPVEDPGTGSGTGGDPQVPTDCCDDELPPIMCMTIEKGEFAGSVPHLAFEGVQIVMTYIDDPANPNNGAWQGSTVVVPDQTERPGLVEEFFGSVRCRNGQFTILVFANTRLLTSSGSGAPQQLRSQDGVNTAVPISGSSCDPFSISATGYWWWSQPHQIATDDSGDPQPSCHISIEPGECHDCLHFPTVTLSTTSWPGASASLTITGTGFSVVPSENLVTFTPPTLGVTGHCTAVNAAGTSMEVVIDDHPSGTGALYAVVTTNGCSSGTAIQVATVAAPLTGITIIGIGSTQAFAGSATVNLPAVQVGLVVVNVMQVQSTTTPSVLYNGISMTLATSQGTGPKIFQFYLATLASPDPQVLVLAPGVVTLGVQVFNVTGLASNQLDKTASASGTGGALSGGIIFCESAGPHEVTTDAPHGLATGAVVTNSGLVGRPDFNGTFTITVTATNKYTLDGEAGAPGSSSESGTWTSGSGSASPSTGATAATTVANEAAISCFIIKCTAVGTYIFGNSFTNGGQTLLSSDGTYQYLMLEGRKILSSTGAVTSSLTLSSFANTSWSALVGTYK